MKKILFFAATLYTSLAGAQTSNAKLQWSRVQYGIASDYEHALKSYRDPSSGNVFVLYQGIYNFGVTRFDNSGASTANNKYRAPHNWYSFGGDFEYTGNNTYVVSGGESAIYPLVVKADINGTVLWKYSDQVPSGVVYQNYYDLLKGVTVSANGNVVACGVAADTASLYSLSSTGTLNWKKQYVPAGYSTGIIMDVQTDAFDNIYTCGTIKNASGDYDAFVMATDQNGVLKWDHIISGVANANDSAIVLRIDNSGNTYVGGFVKDSSATNNTMFFVKYNASGGQQYFKKFHVTNQVTANFGDVFVDPLGNLYACETVYTGVNYAIGYINKYNSSGGLLWSNPYDNIYGTYDRPTSIKADAMGNVYVAGTTELSSPSSPNEFLIKIPASGMTWTYTYDNANNNADKAVDVQIDNSGNSYVIGTNSTYYNIEANVTIFKCSSNGTFQWDGLFDSPGNLTDNAIQVIKDGSYAIYTLSSIENNISKTDASITKYDAKGVLLWQVMYDYLNATNDARSMVMDSHKNIYVLCGANGNSSMVLKYDSLGSQVFENYYPDGYSKMVIDANDNLYLAGGSGLSVNEYNALKLDKDGNVLWTFTPGGGSYNHYANFIKVNPAGELFVFGYKMSPWNSSILRVAKFSTGGTPAWSYDIANIDTMSSAGVFASDMILDNASNMYITGRGKNTSHVKDFILLIKIDQAGNIKWRSEYNNNDSRYAASTDMDMDTYGNLWTIDNNNFIQRWDTANGGVPMDVALNSSYHGTGFLAGGNSLIKKYGNGHFLITSVVINNYDYSLALIKADTAGVFEWMQTYDGAAGGSEYAVDYAFDLQGRIVVHANSQETEGSLNDVATLKFCDLPVPAVSSSGSYINICPGNPVTLTAASASSYSWIPTGSTQQAISTDTSGNYYCFVYQSDGCFQSTDTLTVTQKQSPAVQNICLVTVDSLSTHNILLWDKTGLSLVDHFNLYREDITNVYNLIATVPFDSLSEYHDYASNPNITTKRYKITAVDTCGAESPMSPYHNTIYITDNGSGQFTWNLYSIENSPNPVTNYLLMRDDNGTGAWHQIGSTAGTQQTLNDPSYSSYLNGLWRVETVWGISCTPTLRTGNSTMTTIVKSKSNISNNKQVGIKNNAEKLLKIYPNPTNGNVTITFAPADKTIVRVTSLLGEEVFVETLATGATKCEVDLSKYQSGTYLVQVTTNEQTFQKRVVKN